MAVTRNSSRRRNSAPTETEVAPPESENTNVTTDTVDYAEALDVHETAEVVAPEQPAAEVEKPKRKYNRPTEAIEARRRISEYKKAEEARSLLTGLGFTVEAPESWEHPDKVNERERAKKALAAYIAAGGSVEDLQTGQPEE